MSAQIVSFRCILKDRFGHIISTSLNHNVSTDLQMGSEEKTPLIGLVREMQNLTVGERREIFVRAQDAYGYYDPTRLHTVLLEEWPRSRSPVMGEEVQLTDGLMYRVVEIKGDEITLDANHPLAGQDLIFDIEATEVKADLDRVAEPSPLEDSNPATNENGSVEFPPTHRLVH